MIINEKQKQINLGKKKLYLSPSPDQDIWCCKGRSKI